jgi:hypothetical protein
LPRDLGQGSEFVPSVELAEYLQNMVWEEVTNYAWTGVFIE